MGTIYIEIEHDADPARFAPSADDCPAYEYDLMIDGLDATIADLHLPGSNGIATGAVILDGFATEDALDRVEGLEWVKGVNAEG
jgi:hypothetical protein